MKNIKLPVFSAIFLLWLGVTTASFAQEIDATVHIDLSQINNTSLDYLNNLAGKFQSYLNKYSWTNDTFQPYERIRATFQITLISANNNHSFTANLVVRSLRPIYNTDRQTTVFCIMIKTGRSIIHPTVT